jgi:hypothetical protein
MFDIAFDFKEYELTIKYTLKLTKEFIAISNK